eukprot:9619024-Alexandrium_andersonii.AAC.1
MWEKSPKLLCRGPSGLSRYLRSYPEPSGALQGSISERSGDHKPALALATASLRPQRVLTKGGGMPG